jgi:hypothetical protein
VPGCSTDRSPYTVDLAAFVERFATSPERKKILGGLLKFRQALHKQGIVRGFQWLDGSFLEDVETLEKRHPRDMDIVTLFHLPDGDDQSTLTKRAGTLFHNNHLKTTYAMDAYFVVLDQPTDEWQVRNVSYWYSMWSHRRDGLWKGFVQIDLDSAQDGDAGAILSS